MKNMKRLLSVILFLILAGAAFLGIFQYAKNQENLKKQRSDTTEKVVVYTDLQSGMLEPLNAPFYKETGMKLDIVYLTSNQMDLQILIKYPMSISHPRILWSN